MLQKERDFQQLEISESFIQELRERRLSIEEYTFLYCKHFNLKTPPFLSDVMEKCITRGLYNFDTDTVNPVFVANTFKPTQLDWIDEWREIFPKGKKQGSLPLRGDRMAIRKKMTKFMKTYDFTTEEIINATKQYIREQERDNFNYTKVAHYLIEKDGVSTLASICEAFREGPTTTSDVWVQKA